MTRYPNDYASLQQPASNGLGMAGFIVSLVGFVVTGGVLCPIGFILSLIALSRPPRGFAIAGTIIGAIGTIVPVVIFLIFGAAAISFCSCLSFLGNTAARMSATETALKTAETRVESFRAPGARLPDDAAGDALVRTLNDGWEHPLHYRRLAATRFEVRSAGPDGVLDNSDDLVETAAVPAAPPARLGPGTR
jgi:hypothetical protein